MASVASASVPFPPAQLPTASGHRKGYCIGGEEAEGGGGRQCSPPLPQALGSQASTSFQTLRTEQEVELFSYWNFLRETKKAMPKFTFKV